MRTTTIRTADGPRLAVATDDGWRAAGPAGTTMLDLVADPHLADDLGPVLDGPHAPLLRPGKIIAIGLNYRDHVRETGMAAPTAPLMFAKFPSTVSAHGTVVTVPGAITRRVDWEVELAAVIGRTAKDVPVDEALDHVFGYTVGNDLSARDLQLAESQWIRGKNLDGFCPLGPHLVTADEIGDPQDLALRTTVNGEVVQDSRTGEMIFSTAELVAYCSAHVTLEPGDVILTGTPWGCGEFLPEPRHLGDGDVVECTIEGIGTLATVIAVH
ncbi:fumarylacetoacetate hydrolase family protein [Cellulomonas sp. Sa3CUA2]|uniref:Fumarylacetoacetate hydrolase family protein n=1 Tax=Cellulomonas avistercoris TaxID=2762242 RepID=A0ABR8QGR6_9CELL|nr:fumarylacetoacetate hydrolase family protein [Cellulomonas avistercoris]MBD7919617.1 fumarylacetoacetate hydrolase family protein [Cellulomonas avistercoris]